jgi:hypothetical protein
MEIKLDKVTFEFTQEEHCCSTDMNGIETLTIECMSDMGISDSEGAFYVLKTEQWAINDMNELKQLFDKIEQAINVVK